MKIPAADQLRIARVLFACADPGLYQTFLLAMSPVALEDLKLDETLRAHQGRMQAENTHPYKKDIG